MMILLNDITLEISSNQHIWNKMSGVNEEVLELIIPKVMTIMLFEMYFIL